MSLTRFGICALEKPKTDFFLAGVSLFWVLWQIFGVEIIRPPWDDEIMYVLPAINFHEGKGLTIPQLGSFMGADRVWGWHVPSYTLGLVAWLSILPASLSFIRLYTILPAAFLLFLVARFLLSQIQNPKRYQIGLVTCLVFFDKSFVIQSCTGRMEFHALLFFMISLLFAFRKTKKEKPSWLDATISGLSLGISITFHPIMIYFSPLIIAACWLREKNKTFRAKALLVFFGALSLPLAMMGVWFLHQGEIALRQFFLSVLGSGAEDTRGGPWTITQTIFYAYRFQPGAALISIWAIVLWLAKLNAQMKIPKSSRGISLPGFSLAGIGIFYLAMMRGSTQNLNYYVIFTFFLTLFIGSVLAKEWVSGVNYAKKLGLFFAVTFCLNNLVFASFKTVVVWQNKKNAITSKKNDFLKSLDIPSGATAILPPNLWDFAEESKMQWRVSYLPPIGLREDTYRNYNLRNIKNQPEYIIFDTKLWPDKSINEKSYDLSGYKQIGEFAGVYAYRPAYSGWSLEVFRKKPK